MLFICTRIIAEKTRPITEKKVIDCNRSVSFMMIREEKAADYETVYFVIKKHLMALNIRTGMKPNW